MIEDLPVKVQCNTCQGTHKYRRPVAAKKPAAAKKPVTRRTKADPQAAERQQWQDLESSFNPSAAVGYSMDETYKISTLIKHPTFGIGQVQELAGTRKMLVLFADGAKVLRCG
jgi:hypothetical protein